MHMKKMCIPLNHQGTTQQLQHLPSQDCLLMRHDMITDKTPDVIKKITIKHIIRTARTFYPGRSETIFIIS